MDIQVVPVTLDEKEILRNLYEKYAYEFSQYNGLDVNPLGLYGFKYLDHYWTQAGCFPFFIKVDARLAGLILVNNYPEDADETDYTMSEFFVMHKYRKQGVGRYAASFVFDRFKGCWQLKRHPKNLASVRFWDSVVTQYTHGDYRMVRTGPEGAYADGTPGEVLLFRT
ncbi:MAG: GNAT family N-acetyltransferase [Clostridia bacterium]|nr:GNAT family N-acetyltransferase [Clostridia bacterium]